MTPEYTQREALRSQLAHWALASQQLDELDNLASPKGWARLEQQTGVLIRASMHKAVRRLNDTVRRTRGLIESEDLHTAVNALHKLRREYRRTETTLDFFADAINTRTTPQMSTVLAAADHVARLSMSQLLKPLGHPVPPAVTFIDKGLGASILKAGIRLWDRQVNPIAAIKIVFHSAFSPSFVGSLVHEAGHQVAHVTNWNEELRAALASEIPGEDGELVSTWSSEIAADAISLVTVGYGAVTGLRNVVDSGPRSVFMLIPQDPHPVSWLRVLIDCEHCNYLGGRRRPWLALADTWQRQYPLEMAPREFQQTYANVRRLLPRISQVVLARPYKALGGRALIDRIDPRAVSPDALEELARRAGPRLYENAAIVRQDPIRLFALSAYRIATRPAEAEKILKNHQSSLRLLGSGEAAA